MKLLVLHLSDIHFSASANPILNRIDGIAAATSNLAEPIDSLLIVVSGDNAYSGKSAEYQIAIDFLHALLAKLKESFSNLNSIHIATVPGNHDVDDAVIGDEPIAILGDRVIHEEKQVSTSSEVYNTLLSSQKAYREFSHSVTDRSFSSVADMIDRSFSFKVGEYTIKVRELNTAILSRKHEVQGKLWFPLEMFDAKRLISSEAANDFAICIYHHPDKWLESNNATSFRAQTEACADLILMGHQHTPDSYYSESLTGDHSWYSAGDVLQDDKNEKRSGFAVMHLDFSERSRRRISFDWNGSLYTIDSDTGWRPFTSNVSARAGYVIRPSFQDDLNSPGNLISHSQKKHVSLRDIYEPCRLRVLGNGLTKNNETILAENLPAYIEDRKKTIIFGESQSGKTTLAKRFFSSLVKVDGSRVPILLSGPDCKSPKDRDVNRWITSGFQDQYAAPSKETYLNLPPERRIIMVDRWHDLREDERAKGQVFRILETFAHTVILFADNWYQVEEYTEAMEDGHYTLSIGRLMILPYAPWQRTNMIERWVSLGREEVTQSAQRIYEVDAAERHLDDLTNTGLLPRYPLNILVALQTLQAIEQAEPDMGSLGYLYDTLVDRALKAISADAPEVTINRQFIAIMAGDLFVRETTTATLESLKQLAQKYLTEFAIDVDLDNLVRLLQVYKILKVNDGNVRFVERYVYYYFVAEYFVGLLARRSTKDAALAKLKEMAEYIAYEEYAQVLIFVIYKTRNIDLIDEVILNSQTIFEGAKISDMDTDVEFVASLERFKPKVSLGTGEVQENRTQRRREMSDDEGPSPADREKVKYSRDMDKGAKIQHAFKSMQMMGRILRNFPGHLEAATKRQLAVTTYEVGLRVLSMLFDGVKAAVPVMQATLINAIREDTGDKYDDRELARRADQVIALIVVGSALAIITAISTAVGSGKLRQTYRQVSSELERTIATDLINVAIELENFQDIPINALTALEEQLKTKYVAHQLLRYLVWKRLMYLPVASRATRQQLCERFDIQIAPAMLLAKNPTS